MSFLYRSARLYEFAMKRIYGQGFQERYAAISALIPDGAEVLDVCAGDCYLYRHYLIERCVRYTAVDSSPQFAKKGRREGIHFLHQNAGREESFPRHDYVIMMASLYQFIPDEKKMLDKLKAAARKVLIIAEPVSNLSSSGNFLLRAAAKAATYPCTKRFDEKSLMDFLHKTGFTRFEKTAGGREIIAVLENPETN